MYRQVSSTAKISALPNRQVSLEKQCPSHRPDWVTTSRVPRQRRPGFIDYCVINDLSALVWAANLADLELHTFLHRGPQSENPDFLVIDLDPGPPADLIDCCDVALRLCLLQFLLLNNACRVFQWFIQPSVRSRI